MAYVQYGTRHNRESAREILMMEIRRELNGFASERNNHYFNAFCISRLAYILESLIQHPENDSVEHEGLRFSIREF